MSLCVFTFSSRIGCEAFPLRLVRMNPQPPTILHCHEFTELVIIYSGRGDHVDDAGTATEISAGDIFLFPQGESGHRYRNTQDMCLVNIIFERKTLPLPLFDVFNMPGFHLVFGDSYKSGERLNTIKLTSSEMSALMPLTGRLEADLKSNEPGSQFASMASFMQIVHFISKAAGGRMDDMKAPATSIARALSLLCGRFQDPALTVDDLAAAAHMSQSTLLRRFKRQTGFSPKEYLLKLRLKAACGMLLDGDMRISEIAFRCGFSDGNYFAREFRKELDCSPREWRTRNKGAAN